ncbi:hypothetical protein MED297_09091 [Reinekea sp. MED297]|uniref:Uncharacterized protein n=1 Tax=Reinekea blandensis MED297 TaxID=314283 RepID=A4BGK2_9GAMM|nr:hypothetical protein MED297_09091 [Reinekea sp. MED297] [Reinekea blandensis MED297]
MIIICLGFTKVDGVSVDRNETAEPHNRIEYRIKTGA